MTTALRALAACNKPGIDPPAAAAPPAVGKPTKRPDGDRRATPGRW